MEGRDGEEKEREGRGTPSGFVHPHEKNFLVVG